MIPKKIGNILNSSLQNSDSNVLKTTFFDTFPVQKPESLLSRWSVRTGHDSLYFSIMETPPGLSSPLRMDYSCLLPSGAVEAETRGRSPPSKGPNPIGYNGITCLTPVMHPSCVQTPQSPRMALVVPSVVSSMNSLFIGAFLPSLPLDSLLSTQGIMILLLVAYAGAMWMFLTSAPKVHTVMVSDLEVARQFYEGMLNLPAADVPLHYYYNYEQTLSASAMDPLYMSPSLGAPVATGLNASTDGLWYQLKKNTQLHVISGAGMGQKSRQRHVCFDRDCLELVLMRVQTRGLKHKIRRESPLNFLVKDIDNRVIELAEVSN